MMSYVIAPIAIARDRSVSLGIDVLDIFIESIIDSWVLIFADD